MADNKDLRDGRDRSRVSGSEEYELQHLAQKLNVSTKEVEEALKAVGSSREKVEEYLNNRSRK